MKLKWTKEESPSEATTYHQASLEGAPHEPSCGASYQEILILVRWIRDSAPVWQAGVRTRHCGFS